MAPFHILVSMRHEHRATCWCVNVAQSVLHAPTPTGDCIELALAIANRSAVFFHLHNYEVQSLWCHWHSECVRIVLVHVMLIVVGMLHV